MSFCFTCFSTRKKSDFYGAKNGNPQKSQKSERRQKGKTERPLSVSPFRLSPKNDKNLFVSISSHPPLKKIRKSFRMSCCPNRLLTKNNKILIYQIPLPPPPPNVQTVVSNVQLSKSPSNEKKSPKSKCRRLRKTHGRLSRKR